MKCPEFRGAVFAPEIPDTGAVSAAPGGTRPFCPECPADAAAQGMITKTY